MTNGIESIGNLSLSLSLSFPKCILMLNHRQSELVFLLFLGAYVMLSQLEFEFSPLFFLELPPSPPHSMSKRNFASYNGTSSGYCCCCCCSRGVRVFRCVSVCMCVCEFFWLPFRCCCILDHFGTQTNGFL